MTTPPSAAPKTAPFPAALGPALPYPLARLLDREGELPELLRFGIKQAWACILEASCSRG
jgi:hypothetical protein